MMDIIFNEKNRNGNRKKEIFTEIVCPTEKDFEWVMTACDFYQMHGEAQQILDDGAFGMCPNCEYEFNSELRNEYEIRYCPNCGQKLDWRTDSGCDYDAETDECRWNPAEERTNGNDQK